MLRKGRNARNQRVLLFPQSFITFRREILLFLSHLVCPSASSFNLDKCKILPFSMVVTPVLKIKSLDFSSALCKASKFEILPTCIRKADDKVNIHKKDG